MWIDVCGARLISVHNKTGFYALNFISLIAAWRIKSEITHSFIGGIVGAARLLHTCRWKVCRFRGKTTVDFIMRARFYLFNLAQTPPAN